MRNLQLNGNGHVFSAESMMSSDGVYGRTNQDEGPLPRIDPIRVIKRRSWLIVLAALVVASLAAGVSLVLTPTYETSVLLLIGQKQESDVPGSLDSDLSGLQQLTETVATASSTEPILNGIAQKLDLNSPVVPGSLSAEVLTGTTFVQLYYEDTDPERAQQVANAAGEVISERISEVSPGGTGVTAMVWQRAAMPTTPVSPNPLRNTLLGLMLGVMIGVSLAFLLDFLDDDWTSADEVEQVSGVPTFGVIPAFKTRKLRGRKN